MSYTKGPWHVGKFKNTQYLKVYATNDDLEMICNVAQDKILHNKVQGFEANAKLIAAAPDLLEALQEIFELTNRHHSAWYRASDAIRKAVGV